MSSNERRMNAAALLSQKQSGLVRVACLVRSSGERASIGNAIHGYSDTSAREWRRFFAPYSGGAGRLKIVLHFCLPARLTRKADAGATVALARSSKQADGRDRPQYNKGLHEHTELAILAQGAGRLCAQPTARTPGQESDLTAVLNSL